MDNHGAFGSAFLLKVGDVLFFFRETCEKYLVDEITISKLL